MPNPIKVEKLKLENMKEFFTVRDMVFSSSTGTNFDLQSMFPAVFHHTQECADHHWIIQSAGKIVAGIGSIPAIMNVAGEQLKIEKITGVATDPKEGGKGYMSAIMKEILAHYEHENIVASHLIGQRKRYQHFGYEKTGVSYNFSINKKNIRELPTQLEDIYLSEMRDSDLEAISFAKHLHDQEIIHFERQNGEFYTMLTHWYNKPWIAKTKCGALVGYFILDNKNEGQKKIQEIHAKTPSLFEAMIKAIVHAFGDINLILSPWQADYINSMIDICEHYEVCSCWNWLIRDWQTFVRVFMRAKSTYTYLPDGELNIEIIDYGTLTITSIDNAISCIKSQNTPNLSLDAFTAARLIFGHGNPIYIKELPKEKTATILAWFPLPLYCPHHDAV